ncbi:MAG: hypothetical protein OXG60_20870, partial [Chloroflexi bacterium]|nr:hypothetical protein [Chloroflexota bacterium]
LLPRKLSAPDIQYDDGCTLERVELTIKLKYTPQRKPKTSGRRREMLIYLRYDHSILSKLNDDHAKSQRLGQNA